ncbi:hypothetical protein M8360_34105, partial [Klebsiella pneumoniae]|nr:hypothetical protein [Klebsiella pneumoniae]
MVEGGRQLVEEVTVVAQCGEHPDLFEQTGLAVPDSLDEHRDPATLESRDHIGEDVGAGGVDEFELRHAQDDDLDS